jgi:hypothetical protein
MTERDVTIVTPATPPERREVTANPRPEMLDGGVLGVLLNGKEYSDVVLERVAARLQTQYGLAEVLWWDKGFPAKPADWLDDIAERCTFVLAGVGH